MFAALRCSFCQKPQNSVDTLISSHSAKAHGLYICDECVSVCQKILEDEYLEQIAVKPPDRKYSGEPLLCSFCQKTRLEVRNLISSPPDYPRAYVCNECVSASGQILQDGSRECVGAVSRVPQPVTPESVRNSKDWVATMAWIVILAVAGVVLLAVFSALR